MTIKQSNYIKLIAMLAMVIDHAGFILFPNLVILRIIGRISFPLFAYQIGVGYENTKNIKRYFLRLFSFGAIVQLLYSIVIILLDLGESLTEFNIFFTLTLGLASIYFYNRRKNILLLLTLILPIILKYFGINLDYGLFGVSLILIIYLKKDNPLQLVLFIAAFSLAYDYVATEDYNIQIYSVMSVLFIAKPLSLRFNIPRYAFYLFYPLHLAVLYGIGMVVG